MILLDENLRRDQFDLLKRWGFAVRQIAYEIGDQGMGDSNIIALLRHSKRVTFVTEDSDFWRRDWTHQNYSIVLSEVGSLQTASYLRQLLRNRRFNSFAKRAGNLIRLTPSGIHAWTQHATEETFMRW